MMSKVEDWSLVAADNSNSPPDGFPEGMSPHRVNDGFREFMSACKKALEEMPFQSGFSDDSEIGKSVPIFPRYVGFYIEVLGDYLGYSAGNAIFNPAIFYTPQLGSDKEFFFRVYMDRQGLLQCPDYEDFPTDFSIYILEDPTLQTSLEEVQIYPEYDDGGTLKPFSDNFELKVKIAF